MYGKFQCVFLPIFYIFSFYYLLIFAGFDGFIAVKNAMIAYDANKRVRR